MTDLKFWETVSEVGFGVVIVGVGAEATELAHKWFWKKHDTIRRFREWLRQKPSKYYGYRPRDLLRRMIIPSIRFFKHWELQLETLAVATVFAGLAVEFLGSSKAIRIADRENAVLTQKAEDAGKGADEAVKQGLILAGKLTLVSGELSDAKPILDMFGARMGIFRDRLGASKRLSEFKGVKAEISYHDDDRAKLFSSALYKVLQDAQWNVDEPKPDRLFPKDLVPSDGVIIELRPPDNPGYSAYIAQWGEIQGKIEWQQTRNRQHASDALLVEIRERTKAQIIEDDRLPRGHGIFVRVAFDPL